MVAEKAGIPSVTVVATSFVALARQLAAAEGMRGMPVAVYPGTISIESDATIAHHLASGTIDQIVAGLTRAPAEAAPTGQQRDEDERP